MGTGRPRWRASLRRGPPETTHAFSDHRPAAYTAMLTVSAMSDTGRVSGSDSFSVRVTESEGFFVGGGGGG